jgi:ABC-type glycerol-3-phosphate transport system substrate-binding protein
VKEETVTDKTANNISRRNFIRKSAQLSAAAGLLGATGFSRARAAGKTELTFWTFLNPKSNSGRSKAQTEMIAAFESKNPNIKINVEIAPWQTVDRQLIQAVNAGRGPDVAVLYSGRLGQHVEAGSILPIEPYVSSWSAAQKDDWIVPWNSLVWNNKKMALFADNRVMIMVYRSDWLEQAGVKSTPKTWIDAAKTASKFTKAPHQWGYITALSQSQNAAGLEEFFVPMLLGMGGQLLGPKNEPYFNSLAGQACMSYLADLVHKYKVTPEDCVSLSFNKQQDGIEAGSYGMAVFGSHRITTIQNSGPAGKKIRTAPVPSPDPDHPSPAIAAGQTFAIAKTSKNPDAAWKFIDHMASADMQFINAKLGGQLPPRKSAYNAAWFKNPDFGAAQLLSWKDYIVKSGIPYKFPNRFAEVSRLLAKSAEQVVGQGVHPADALEQAAGEWRSS